MPTRRQAHRRSVMARWLSPLVAASVAIAALVTWAVARVGDDEPIVVSEDPGVVDVHGLGINPADGDLYVATHSGLFRLPGSGNAVRIGDSYQDTMGFTVVGADRFLGSGHPQVAVVPPATKFFARLPRRVVQRPGARC